MEATALVKIKERELQNRRGSRKGHNKVAHHTTHEDHLKTFENQMFKHASFHAAKNERNNINTEAIAP